MCDIFPIYSDDTTFDFLYPSDELIPKAEQSNFNCSRLPLSQMAEIRTANFQMQYLLQFYP